MYKVGDLVRITVNYLSELDNDKEPVWVAKIAKIDLSDDYCYLIKEVNLWFSKEELELIL